MKTEFETKIADAYDRLEAAQHSLSFAFHMLEMEPTETNIREYEAAIDSHKATAKHLGKVIDDQNKYLDGLVT